MQNNEKNDGKMTKALIKISNYNSTVADSRNLLLEFQAFISSTQNTENSAAPWISNLPNLLQGSDA